MNMIRQYPSRQKGATLYALIVVMTLLGIIIYGGLKISPAYIDDRIISSTIENMREDGELASAPLSEVRRRVTRTMIANGASWDSDSIDVVQEGGTDFLEIQYERRVPMFWNIDAIVKFDYRISKD